MLLVVDLFVVFGGVDSLDELIEFTGGVEAVPHDFSVVGVISSAEALFVSVVEEGDALTGEGEGDGGFEVHVVLLGVEEPGVVVVVDEHSQSGDI